MIKFAIQWDFTLSQIKLSWSKKMTRNYFSSMFTNNQNCARSNNETNQLWCYYHALVSFWICLDIHLLSVFMCILIEIFQFLKHFTTYRRYILMISYQDLKQCRETICNNPLLIKRWIAIYTGQLINNNAYLNINLSIPFTDWFYWL